MKNASPLTEIQIWSESWHMSIKFLEELEIIFAIYFLLMWPLFNEKYVLKFYKVIPSFPHFCTQLHLYKVWHHQETSLYGNIFKTFRLIYEAVKLWKRKVELDVNLDCRYNICQGVHNRGMCIYFGLKSCYDGTYSAHHSNFIMHSYIKLNWKYFICVMFS